MKAFLVLLLACVVTPSVVIAHGFTVNPELTWVVDPFYDMNAPAAFYNANSDFGRNPLDLYSNLRYIIDRDSPNTNIPLIAANANKKCGMTSTTGAARSVTSFRFEATAIHEGPCEVWVDDVRTLSTRSCKTAYPGSSWNIPVDMSKCTRSTCVVQFIWVGIHNPTWEVFKNCFPVTGGSTGGGTTTTGGGTTTTGGGTTTTTTTCTNVAANGGLCGAANGGKYYPGTQCCSQAGYCGVGSPWCDANSNSIYNGDRCSTSTTSTTSSTCAVVAAAGGKCGAANGGAYCSGTQCCSQAGYCGVGSPWCDTNSNSIYNGGRCTTALLLADTADETEAAQIDQAQEAEQATQVSGVSTAILANGAASLDTILTRRIFDKVFLDTEGSVLTYDRLIEAAQSYTKFAQTPNPNINVLEVAYFLAHVAYTTDDLTYTAEREGTMYDSSKYCQSSSAYKCAPGANYYGRGPLYLRWNFNYLECGNAIGVDLYSYPDQALESPSTAWKTAFWMWFHLGIHEMSTLPNAFALSTAKLVGDVECGNTPSALTANAARIAKFKTIAQLLNAKSISKLSLSCTDDTFVLIATEGNTTVTNVSATTQLVANARLMSAETETHASGWANVAVVGVAMTAMTAFVVLAVIKRTGDPSRAAPNVENGDYALLTGQFE